MCCLCSWNVCSFVTSQFQATIMDKCWCIWAKQWFTSPVKDSKRYSLFVVQACELLWIVAKPTTSRKEAENLHLWVATVPENYHIVSDTCSLCHARLLLLSFNHWVCYQQNHSLTLEYFIYTCKCNLNEQSLLFSLFKTQLRENIMTERYIAIKNKTAKLFNEKWKCLILKDFVPEILPPPMSQ